MARLSGCLSRAAACCCLQTSRAAWRCAWSSSATSIWMHTTAHRCRCLRSAMSDGIVDGIVDVCRLLFDVCVPCGRQQSSWCVEERYRPASVHCLSSLVWGSPKWFGSSRVGPGSACARVQTLSTQGRRIRQLSSRGRDSWVCRCLAPPLRVREFTDDVISRVHLHLCLLDVRFIAQSSVKVDAQVHWCCCVWESGTVPHYIQFSFGFSVP